MEKMSNEQAIIELDFLARNYAEMNKYCKPFKGTDKLQTACEMGIEALKEQRARKRWSVYRFKGGTIVGNGFICECGRIVLQLENYCPECGAEMLMPKKGANNG